MSALPPEADIEAVFRYVCYGPIADSCNAARLRLFDYFLCERHEGAKAEGGPQIIVPNTQEDGPYASKVAAPRRGRLRRRERDDSSPQNVLPVSVSQGFGPETSSSATLRAISPTFTINSQ